MPITSYGIILFHEEEEQQTTERRCRRRYLMICRKDSFGYIDFMRGKYSLQNTFQLKNILNEMTLMEKERIRNDPFDKMWVDMWGGPSYVQYKNEEHHASRKLTMIRKGTIKGSSSSSSDPPLNMFLRDPPVEEDVTSSLVPGGPSLQTLIEESTTAWTTPEWEFPKGRRNNREKDLGCALREFQEETGIPVCCLKVFENVSPFEEIFLGTNYKSYKHKYFLAQYIGPLQKNLTNYQKTEVSGLAWMTLEECLQAIRPYHREKQRILQDVDSTLNEYYIPPPQPLTTSKEAGWA
jgi:8-oxo-dGTP pyrophosphatase MutT (NUDIX family)